MTPTSDDTSGTDYSAVSIPDDTPPEQYHYTQRRAEILDLIQQAGHPSAVRQDRLAERYDVTPSQISRDMDRLADHIAQRVGDREQRALLVDSVIQKSIEELIDAGEYRAAVKSVLEYAEWAQSHADLAELDARIEAIEQGGAPTAGRTTLAEALDD
jgi:transposase